VNTEHTSATKWSQSYIQCSGSLLILCRFHLSIISHPNPPYHSHANTHIHTPSNPATLIQFVSLSHSDTKVDALDSREFTREMRCERNQSMVNGPYKYTHRHTHTGTHKEFKRTWVSSQITHSAETPKCLCSHYRGNTTLQPTVGLTTWSSDKGTFVFIQNWEIRGVPFAEAEIQNILQKLT